MKKTFAAGLILLSAVSLPLKSRAEEEVRPAAAAGSFYSADPKMLAESLEECLGRVVRDPEVHGDARLLILPHAGHVFSGPTAAYGYVRLKELRPSTVVMIGPSHQRTFAGVSVWRAGRWLTPLGSVDIDRDLAEAIVSEDAAFQFIPEAHLGEHALEVHLPFLQAALGTFKIVPIALNDTRPEITARLAQAIAEHLPQTGAVVVSTDMSHYHSEETARQMDANTLEYIRNLDAAGLRRQLRSGHLELCGGAAVLTGLELAKLLGGTGFTPLRYDTSASASGDSGRVVGYSACAMISGPGRTISEERRRILLRLAREAVESHVREGRLPGVPAAEPWLREPRAVFVTLMKDGELRGCIGRVFGEEPLGEAVRNLAVESASRDSRFTPVGPDELTRLRYEVSVLSPPRRITEADAIQPGRHGVILRRGASSGVYLPKVASAFAYDRTAFLRSLCSEKAGLEPDCWKDPATEILVFTAEEFGEEQETRDAGLPAGASR